MLIFTQREKCWFVLLIIRASIVIVIGNRVGTSDLLLVPPLFLATGLSVGFSYLCSEHFRSRELHLRLGRISFLL